jgi:hypothetical protein
MTASQNPPQISAEAQAAISAQQRVFERELGLELQLRNAALHEAVENSSLDDTAENIVVKAVIFLNFLKTGESK